jgi:phosphatidylinositol alpha-mannosyltransferase
VLLAAFDLLLEEFPRLRLRVVGDGPLRDICHRDLSARARPRVEFLGQLHREPLVEAYRDCDVFCAPSLGHESFGITLLEAMAAGKPIVAADIPGYRDVVRDGEEALLYPSASPRALCDALRRVVTDAGMRACLAEHGGRRVQAYGWPRVAAAIAGHYERLLRERC